MQGAARFPGWALGVALLFAAYPVGAEFGAEDWVGRERPSVEDLELAVEANPRDFLSLMALGMARLEDGEPHKAADSFAAAVAANPDSAPAHLFLAWAYNDQLVEYPIKTRGAIDPPDAQLPGIPPAKRRRLPLKTLADREFETALHLDPTDPFAWALWGRALLGRSVNNPLLIPTADPEPILTKFRTALEIDPGHSKASGGLARVLYAYGNLYLHYLARPGGPNPPPWAPEDLAGAARDYLDEATEIYWSLLLAPPDEITGNKTWVYNRLLELLIVLERSGEALTLCRRHTVPSDVASQLPQVFKRHWQALLRSLKDREGDTDRYRSAFAAFQDCVSWLDGEP